MKIFLLATIITAVLTACSNDNNSDVSSDSASKVNSTTPPISDTSTPAATSDTSTMGRMMGDTTKVKGDSTK